VKVVPMVWTSAVLALAAPAWAASCEGLAVLPLPQTRITAAQLVSAGSFAPPGGRPGAYASVPEFCRVAATLTPSSDSDIG
jgi:feruloyl esterase